MTETKIAEIDGVREYCEGEIVELWLTDHGRLVIRAYNEARFRGTDVDLLDLVEWIFAQGIGPSLDRDGIRSKLSAGENNAGHGPGH